MSESEKWPACPGCGKCWEPNVKVCERGPHYAEKRCSGCNRHLGWVPKPDRDKAKRETQHADLVRKHASGFCELCLIRQEVIPPGETLEAHHVLEYEMHDGMASRGNLWILCTACHKLIHWRRTYLKHLLPEGVFDGDTAIADGAKTVGLVEDDTPRREANEGALPNLREAGE